MRHSVILQALWLVGCLGAKDNALFSKTDASTSGGGSSNLGGSSAAESGTGSVNPAAGVGGSVSAEGGEPTMTDAGGSSSASGTAPGGASGAAAGGASAVGGQPPMPSISSCDMLEGALVDEQNHHCYRLEPEEMSFAAARDACIARGGHLVTITDEAENDFVLQVHGDAHWLGASDGRDDRTPGVGTYSWLSAEPWSYEHWEGGQPNAHAIDCPNESGGAHCYEHCAYQNGDGNWLDRACWNSIPVVCEWDLGPDAEGSGQGGAP